MERVWETLTDQKFSRHHDKRGRNGEMEGWREGEREGSVEELR